MKTVDNSLSSVPTAQSTHKKNESVTGGTMLIVIHPKSVRTTSKITTSTKVPHQSQETLKKLRKRTAIIRTMTLITTAIKTSTNLIINPQPNPPTEEIHFRDNLYLLNPSVSHNVTLTVTITINILPSLRNHPTMILLPTVTIEVSPAFPTVTTTSNKVLRGGNINSSLQQGNKLQQRHIDHPQLTRLLHLQQLCKEVPFHPRGITKTIINHQHHLSNLNRNSLPLPQRQLLLQEVYLPKRLIIRMERESLKSVSLSAKFLQKF